MGFLRNSGSREVWVIWIEACMSKNCETCSLFDSIIVCPLKPASKRNTRDLYRKVAIACHNVLNVDQQFTN